MGARHHDHDHLGCDGHGGEVSYLEWGGGILNFGDLTLDSTIVSENDAHFGGGIHNEEQATLTVRDSTITDNSAGVGSP